MHDRRGTAGSLGIPCILIVVLAGMAGQALGQVHEDKRLGYRLIRPKEWQPIPIKTDEQWIVAKYISNRQDFYTDKELGWTFDSKPEMQVIAFPEAATKRKKVEATKEGDTIFISVQNPFKNYKDYLERTYSEGGWYISDEKEQKVNGVDVTCYEMKVEKLAQTGPRRIVTWVYHCDDVDLAVHFECLEDAFKKHGPTFYGSLKSFKRIDRTEGNLGPDDATGRISLTDLDKLSAQDRTMRKRQLEKVSHDKAIAALTEGWQHQKMGDFLVLDHADDKFKYASKLVKQAQALMVWLEKTFDYIGSEEYVRTPILRVCKDYDEERAFSKGSGIGDWMGVGTEIVSHRNVGFGREFEFEWINQRVLDIWFQDRDRELFWGLPPWLDAGLRQMVGAAEPKGSSLQFRPNAWERVDLKIAAKKGEITSPRELMKLEASKFASVSDAESYSNRVYEAAALVRFLLAGEGAKNPKTKDAFHEYMKNLKTVIEEIEKKDEEKTKDNAPDKTEKPKTEEEEDEYFKNQRSKWQDRRQEILDEVFNRTFGTWTDEDWKQFESVYIRSIMK